MIPADGGHLCDAFNLLLDIFYSLSSIQDPGVVNSGTLH